MTGVRPVLTGLAGVALDSAERELLRRLRPSGVLLFERNVRDRDAAVALIADVKQTLVDAGVRRPLVACDAEGGLVFPPHAVLDPGPTAATLGRIDRVDVTRAVHRARAVALAGLGIDLVLGPVADVDVPGNPVIGVRAFGRDAGRVADHVRAAIEGLHAGGVATCVKHWPGHGATRIDSHVALPTVERDADVLDAVDGLPFRAAVSAGTDALMPGHVHVPAWAPDAPVPVGVDPVQVARIRDVLGFHGPVLSDAIEMGGLAGHGAGDLLRAGIDLVLHASPVGAIADELERIEPTEAIPSFDVRLAASGTGAFAWADALDRKGSWPEGRRPWIVVDAAGDDRLLRTPDRPEAPLAGGRRLAAGVWARTFGPAAASVDVVGLDRIEGLDPGAGAIVALLSVRAGAFDACGMHLGRLRPAAWFLAGAAAIDPLPLDPGRPVARTAEIRPDLLARILRESPI